MTEEKIFNLNNAIKNGKVEGLENKLNLLFSYIVSGNDKITEEEKDHWWKQEDYKGRISMQFEYKEESAIFTFVVLHADKRGIVEYIFIFSILCLIISQREGDKHILFRLIPFGKSQGW